MKRETFDRAFEQISDGLVQDALNVYDKKRNRRKVWVRVAAMAATVAIVLTATLWPRQTPDGEIITAPGILKVYAYDLENANGADISQLEGIELEEGIEFPSRIGWGPSINVYPGLPIKLSVPEEYYGDAAISFKIAVDNGEFFRKYTLETGFYWWGAAYLGKGFVLENHQIIYWHEIETNLESVAEIEEQMSQNPEEFLFPEWVYSEEERTLAEITIYANEHIVGAALVEIYTTNEEDKGAWYQAKLLDTVCFPLIGGKYQPVTEMQVNEYMENWKK